MSGSDPTERAPSPRTGGRTMSVKDALAAARARQQAGEIDAARAICAQVLGVAPNYGPALHLMGLIAYDLGDGEVALDHLRRAAAATPDKLDLKINLARMLRGLGRLEEATEAFRELRAEQPDHAEIGELLFQTCKSLGQRTQNEGRIAESRTVLEEALSIRPDDPETRFLYAGALLLGGDLEHGFQYYEARWDVPDFPSERQDLPRPQWDGGDLTGKTILIYPEQGLGDSIHFSRYLPILKQRGARTVLAAGPALSRLFATLEGVDAVIDLKGSLPAFDVHAPIMSLPYLCGTTLESVPGAVPYLSADPAAVVRWRDRFASLPGRKIGLVWAGNPKNPNDKKRSLSLDALAPLLSLPGISWVSLQADERRGDLEALGAGAPLELGDDLGDFAETAAIIASLDAVVCVDTAAAHLAGALGHRTFLLLAQRPDWRWLLDRDDSPWYPSMTLFRQDRPGDWTAPVGKLAGILQEEREVGHGPE